MDVLITDLDNTLYDWVTFFSKSFQSMVTSLVKIIKVDEEQILNEFKALHQRYGTIERPFTILELPSVKAAFGQLQREALLERLDPALHAFNSTRKDTLTLYDGVPKTIETLRSRGVKIIAYTDASAINSYFRLSKLGIADAFTRIYATDGREDSHPNPVRRQEMSPTHDLVRILPADSKKPNPEVLMRICRAEGVSPQDCCYIGDSLSKDVWMAQQANIVSVWARYGLNYDSSFWKTLVSVTHWTPEDVERESELKSKSHDVTPDYTANCFGDVLHVFYQN